MTTQSHDPPDFAAIAPQGGLIAGKYRVEHVIGEGGMAIVVVAQHMQLDRQVALKILKPSFLSSPDVLTRFLREARAVSHLSSEHVARVLDVGTLDQGLPFLVMEYLQGADLGSVLADRGHLPLVETVDLVLQAMDAIAEAHAQGIVHRDLKPENLFLTSRADGTPLIKVLDFGIAKSTAVHALPGPRLTQSSATFGSPAYMSPEQFRSAHDVDARADIWALGVILYELVSGRLPFSGDTATETCARVLRDEPEPLDAICPELPSEFIALVHKCLMKDRVQRFPDVASLASAVAPFGGRAAREYARRIHVVLGGGIPALPSPSSPSFTSPVLAVSAGSIDREPLFDSPTSTTTAVVKRSAAASQRRTGLIVAATLGVIILGGVALHGVNRRAVASTWVAGRTERSLLVAARNGSESPLPAESVELPTPEATAQPTTAKTVSASAPKPRPKDPASEGSAVPSAEWPPVEAPVPARSADMYGNRR